MDGRSNLDQPATPTARERELGHRSLAFLLDQVVSGVAGLGARDALLVMAIHQANIARLVREPEARLHYGHLENPAPDAERRPVSVSAIAASLGLSFETVRRRIKHLEGMGVCATTDNGVIVPETFLTSPPYLQSVVAANVRLRAFYLELRAAGLLDPLPPSAFQVDDVVPARAAARLLSDYVLREADHLMSVAGDVVSAVVLLGVLASSTAPPAGTRAATVVLLARRLGIPAETVRRHASHLVDEGHCVRTRAGLLITEERQSRPDALALRRENAANVKRMFAGLAERGVIAAWDRQDSAAV